MNISSDRQIGLWLAVFGTFLFSFKSIVIKLAYQYDIDAYQLIGLRMLFCAPIYFCILIYLDRKTPIKRVVLMQNKWLVLAAGMLGYYIASLLDVIGLQYVTAQLARLILYTFPGFVMLYSFFIWRTVPTRNTVLALIFTWSGIATVVDVEMQQNSAEVIFGGTLILISAACFAGYLVLSKRGIAQLGSQPFTCIAMIIASFFVALHLSFIHPVQLLGLDYGVYGFAFILAVFCTVLPSLLIAAAIARIGPQHTSILGGMGPVITAFFAVWILNEPFGLAYLMGTLLVATGVYLVATTKG